VYQFNNAARTGIRRALDGATIPADASNADYVAILASGAEIAPYEPDLAATRAQAVSVVLGAVAAARARYAVDIAFQSAAYEIKAQEADAFAAGVTDPALLPVLAASAAANGVTLAAHAATVRARRDQWLALLAATEGLREAGLSAVRAAETAEAIESERDSYVSQLAAV
jgi:hypothetical protein